ncbi:MAG: MBL fold metallo-hydrolase [Spirochaetales bacterium]|nr:MBL fold metallo-hydrolase [Spirochaetales bacterium]
MKIKFWGVRGSVPTPLTPRQLQNRISAVIERIQPHDIRNQDTREAFMARLPSYLLETIGGNTTCLEVFTEKGQQIIIDAGSGIRGLGQRIVEKPTEGKECHLFFTHFHWDHIQGLPFFDPAFRKGYTIHLYSPVEGFEDILRQQMRLPYFPITMDVMPANLVFHHLGEKPLSLNGMEVSWRKMKHPGGCYSYRFREKDKIFIFSTDTELTEDDFMKNDENTEYFKDADILAIDSQYTLGEAIEKFDWGHSSYSLAVDFASEWGIRKLILFHHEPKYEDKKMFQILKSAGWYKRHLGPDAGDMDILLAQEGLELKL